MDLYEFIERAQNNVYTRGWVSHPIWDKLFIRVISYGGLYAKYCILGGLSVAQDS